MKTIIYTSKLSKVFLRSISRKTFLVLILVCFSLSSKEAYSQVIPSSCTAPVNIVEDYKLDAIQLSLRKFYNQGSPEKDSIEVPVEHRDTILDALIAVYNIDTPERDSIIEFFNIHAHQTIQGGGLIVYINSQFSITEPTLDSLINEYSITYDETSIIQPPFILFDFDIKLNQGALIKELLNIQGVIGAEANYSTIRVTDIETQINVDHVELIYSYGWTDCVMGCWFRRYWKFKVYYDCSVEFIESYGDTNPVLGINNEKKYEFLKIFPNPTAHELNFTLKNNSKPIKLEIFDLTGKRVKSKEYINQGNENFNGSIDVSALKEGLYFCRFSVGGKQVTRKFIKN